MKDYEVEKYKKIIRTKEDSLMIHIQEMDRLRVSNRSLKRKILFLEDKISKLIKEKQTLQLPNTIPYASKKL